MKKFLLLSILFLMLSGGCMFTKHITRYERDYSEDQKELMIEDVQNAKWLFDFDSVPFDNWILTQAETPCGYKIERSYLLKDAPKHEFLFIYTTFIEKDTTYYKFEILERGKYNFKK